MAEISERLRATMSATALRVAPSAAAAQRRWRRPLAGRRSTDGRGGRALPRRCVHGTPPQARRLLFDANDIAPVYNGRNVPAVELPQCISRNLIQ